MPAPSPGTGTVCSTAVTKLEPQRRPHSKRSLLFFDVTMGDPAVDEEMAENQPQPAGASSLPEEIVQQILRFFRVDEALRCGRTSRAFSRASVASLTSASCGNGVSGCGTHCYCYCCCCCNGGSFGSSSDENVGTPFLDLRDGGDAVDCLALSTLLRRVFSKREDPRSTAAVADGTRSDAARSLGQSESASSESGRTSALKGLALCSAAVRNEVRCCVCRFETAAETS